MFLLGIITKYSPRVKLPLEPYPPGLETENLQGAVSEKPPLLLKHPLRFVHK